MFRCSDFPEVPEGRKKLGVEFTREFSVSSGLNFLDLMARQGAIDNLPKAPFIMGFELAGEVEAVGEKVEGFAVGQRFVA